MGSLYEYSEAAAMPREDKLVEGMYMKTIAKTINDKARHKIKPYLYKAPADPPAFRLALDYVASWLAVRNLHITLDLANLESNKLVKIDRHRQDYVARNLQLKTHKAVIRQLLKLKAEKNSPENVRERSIRAKMERENPLVQSSDDSEFSEQSIVEEAEIKRQQFFQHNQKHHHSKHHKKEPEPPQPVQNRGISDDDTFTESSGEEPANIWDPHYALDKEKRVQLAAKVERAKSRKSSKKSDLPPQKSEKDNTQYSYSYYTYGDSYTYTESVPEKRRHEKRRPEPSYTDYSYTNGNTYTYSYTGSSYTPYSYTYTESNQKQSFPKPQTREIQPQPTRESQKPKAEYQSFTSPQGSNAEPSVVYSSYSYATEGSNKKPLQPSEPQAQGKEYSYTDYSYTETANSSVIRAAAEKSWTSILKDNESVVKPTKSPFDDLAQKRQNASTGDQNVYNYPPAGSSSTKRSRPVERPVRANQDAPDFLANFNKNEADGTDVGTTDILRQYANAPQQAAPGSPNDFFNKKSSSASKSKKPSSASRKSNNQENVMYD